MNRKSASLNQQHTYSFPSASMYLQSRIKTHFRFYVDIYISMQAIRCTYTTCVPLCGGCSVVYHGLKSSDFSDVLNAWLNTTHCISFLFSFFNFSPKSVVHNLINHSTPPQLSNGTLQHACKLFQKSYP